MDVNISFENPNVDFQIDDLFTLEITAVPGAKGDPGDPATDEQVQTAVDNYLDEHPEIVVEDGSITTAKLADEAVTEAKLSTELQDKLDDFDDDITQLNSELTAIESGETAVGTAEQLLSNKYNEDTEPYHFRRTPYDATREMPVIVGGSLGWNQLISEDGSNLRHIYMNLNYDSETGVIRLTGKGIDNIQNAIPYFDNNVDHIRLKDNHVYLAYAEVTSYVQEPTSLLPTFGFFRVSNAAYKTCGVIPYSTTVKQMMIVNAGDGSDSSHSTFFAFRIPNGSSEYIDVKKAKLIDLTQVFGSTIADYINNLETATTGAGVAWVNRYIDLSKYHAYDAGSIQSVSGLVSHDTVGFNAWDEEWRNGYYNESTGEFVANSAYVANKNPIPALPNTTYYGTEGTSYVDNLLCYDSAMNYLGTAVRNSDNTRTTRDRTAFVNFRTRQSYGGTYNSDICINISDPVKNGTYEPYTKHTYALDPSITLRGVPKLDSNNDLYFDGDIWHPNGQIDRKDNEVDLGTLNWVNYKSGGFHASLSNAKSGTSTTPPNAIASKAYSWQGISATLTNGMATITSGGVYIVDYNFTTDATAFKNSLNGVMLVYEKATPTTETATPYTAMQICDGYGTEEYITTSVVPVGHTTRYPVNQVAKLDGLPSDFSKLLAPTELVYKASKNYVTNNFLIVDNQMYRVTANIATGGTITPNVNVVATTIAEVLSSLL